MKSCKLLNFCVLGVFRLRAATKWLLIFLTIISLMYPEKGHSAPLIVDSSQTTNITVSYKVGKATKHKEIVCLGNVPGLVTKKGSKMVFTSYTKSIKKLLAKVPRPTKKIKTSKAIRKSGVAGCKAAQEEQPDSPPQDPAPTPTPTPIPTVPDSPPNFASNGDVTAVGKTLFGIPSNLSANKFVGQGVLQNKCLACHDENGLFYDFGTLRATTSQSQMGFTTTTLPDQELAHLVAWLNRYQP